MIVGKVKVKRNGSVASLGGDDYYLTIVLKELMKQDVTANRRLKPSTATAILLFI
jgi:hypothetical protein